VSRALVHRCHTLRLKPVGWRRSIPAETTEIPAQRFFIELVALGLGPGDLLLALDLLKLLDQLHQTLDFVLELVVAVVGADGAAVPSAKVVAAIVNPASGSVAERQKSDLQATARQLGLELLVLEAGSDAELDALFPTLRSRAGGLVVMTDAFLITRQRKLAELARENALPAIFQNREFAVAGGLLSYGGDPAETHALAGLYAARILKGEKPADLPVILGSKVELIVNLKTAKALGMDMPQTLLGRANEVIE